MMRSALIGMLLVLPAAIAYSSASTSAYASASGKSVASSAYASKAVASKYASATAPAPAPAPAPAGTVAKKINTITATISLAGVPASAFSEKTEAGKKVRLAFQKTVAKSFKLCGTSGTAQCTSSDIVIVSVTRRRADAKVKFYVKTTKPATAAQAATLSKLLTSTAFNADLKKQAKADGATALESVTGVKVVTAPVAGTTTVYVKKDAIAAASMTAGVSLASLVFAALALQ
jgi:hypothetical protein